MMGLMNEAGWDRAIRVAIGVVMLYLGWAGVVAGTFGTVLKVVGFVPLLTGALGWCPAYTLIHIRTRPAPDA